LLLRLGNALCAALPGVVGVYVFGSHVKGGQTAESDIDLAILPASPLPPTDVWNAAQTVAALAGRDVDVVDLLRASTVLRAQVVAHGRRLYCREASACEEFEDRAFSAYARLNEERRGILDDIRARGSVYGG
jgi:predicted nucleotidyltransferase